MLGDARLTLADAPDASYDLIIVDAFSSDAIPIHLMTREAMAIYRKKLAPHGIVVMHVSNRHLELASVVAGIAAANGLVTRVNEGGDVTENEAEYMFIGTVVAAARADEDFGALAQSQYLGARRRPTRSSGCGPTTIPTSSARSCANTASKVTANSQKFPPALTTVPLTVGESARFRVSFAQMRHSCFGKECIL